LLMNIFLNIIFIKNLNLIYLYPFKLKKHLFLSGMNFIIEFSFLIPKIQNKLHLDYSFSPEYVLKYPSIPHSKIFQHSNNFLSLKHLFILDNMIG
jgi:hypothetical protein